MAAMINKRATELAKVVLKNFPDLRGYFAANEGSSIGVFKAAKEMKRDKVVVIGFDSGKQLKEAAASGAIAGAITQPGRYGLQDGRGGTQGDPWRETAQGDRYGLLFLRQEQHERPEDCRGALRLTTVGRLPVP